MPRIWVRINPGVAQMWNKATTVLLLLRKSLSGLKSLRVKKKERERGYVEKRVNGGTAACLEFFLVVLGLHKSRQEEMLFLFIHLISSPLRSIAS